MFNLNRRHTKALEKSARAEKRLADAEETIAQHLGEFLRNTDAIGASQPANGGKGAASQKKKPSAK